MAENGEVTIVGAGARLEGNVVSAGSLRIDGQVKGQINADGDVALVPAEPGRGRHPRAERQRGRQVQGQHHREGQGAPRARRPGRRQHHVEDARRRGGRHLPRAEHHGRDAGVGLGPVRPASQSGARGRRRTRRKPDQVEGVRPRCSTSRPIREDPERVPRRARAAEPRRGRRPAARRRRAPALADHARRGAARRAEPRLQGDRRRARATRSSADRRGRHRQRRAEGARAAAGGGRGGRCRRAAGATPNVPHPSAPRRLHRRGRGGGPPQPRGHPAFDFAPKDHVELGDRAGRARRRARRRAPAARGSSTCWATSCSCSSR